MIFDHGTTWDMKEIAISKFRVTCLAVIENVRKTRRPVRITRFGKLAAEVVPPAREAVEHPAALAKPGDQIYLRPISI